MERHYASVAAVETARTQGDQASFEQFLDELTTQALFGYGLLNSEGAVFETSYHRTDLGETLIRLLRPS